MTDIVKDLRELAKSRANVFPEVPAEQSTEWKAADEIERLRAEVGRLREALDKIAGHETYFPDATNTDRHFHRCIHRKLADEKCADCHSAFARIALKETGND